MRGRRDREDAKARRRKGGGRRGEVAGPWGVAGLSSDRVSAAWWRANGGWWRAPRGRWQAHRAWWQAHRGWCAAHHAWWRWTGRLPGCAQIQTGGIKGGRKSRGSLGPAVAHVLRCVADRAASRPHSRRRVHRARWLAVNGLADDDGGTSPASQPPGRTGEAGIPPHADAGTKPVADAHAPEAAPPQPPPPDPEDAGSDPDGDEGPEDAETRDSPPTGPGMKGKGKGP